MGMNVRTPLLAGIVAGVGLFVGGLVLGSALRDDPDVSTADDELVAIPLAVPADLSVEPGDLDEPPVPTPSPRLVPARLHQPPVDAPTATDPERNTTDEGAPGTEPFRPPTMPGGLDEDGVGTPDPDLPYVVGDWVEETTFDDLYLPSEESPASDESADEAAPTEEPALGEPAVFRDPCADVSEDDAEAAAEVCPDGVGGTIVLLGGGDPPDPLSIMRQLYTRGAGTFELRCPDLGTSVDGVYRAVLPSNNPADFRIRYWMSREPDSVREITYRTSDAERDRWLERRLAGEAIHANPVTGVQNCLELPLPDDMPPSAHFTLEVEGVDDLGSRAAVTIYTEIESAESQLGRPPMAFSPGTHGGAAMSGTVSLAYDPTVETAYLAAIQTTGSGGSGESCSDIEPEVLARRMPAHPALRRFGTAVVARRPDDPRYDSRFSLAATADLFAEEGTTYLLCGWATTPPTRSFDLPTVVHRDSLLVRAPRHLRVRVSVVGGHTDQALDRDSVTVRPANWGPGVTAAPLPGSPVPAGPIELARPHPAFDSGGREVPTWTRLVVEGPDGGFEMLEVITETGCATFFITLCAQPGIDYYDVPLPGRASGRPHCSGGLFGSCDPPPEGTVIGTLRLAVERYGGPGGVPLPDTDNGWVVTPRGAFVGNAGERPARPQIDEFASYLREYRPRPDARPGLQAHLEFDRPVRIEARPVEVDTPGCAEPETVRVDEHRRVHSLRWDELCYGGVYSLSLLAVDEDGNELDLRAVVDGVRTGYPGWGYVNLSAVRITEYTVELTIERLGDGIAPNGAVLRVAGNDVGPFFAPGQSIRCISATAPASTYTRTVRNAGGRPIFWGDLVGIFLEVNATGDGIGCGREARHVRVQIAEQLRLDDLLGSPVHTFVYDEADARLTLTIRDVVPG